MSCHVILLCSCCVVVSNGCDGCGSACNGWYIYRYGFHAGVGVGVGKFSRGLPGVMSPRCFEHPNECGCSFSGLVTVEEKGETHRT